MSASIASTTIAVAGTPTVFFPLATPWPSGTDCVSNIYLRTPVSNPNTFIAWDPLYGQDLVHSAQSCLPPQVSSWWSQPSSSIFTALGPTFECPEAYAPVQTAVVANSLRQTFCCPSQYSLLVPQPNSAKAFPSQCISKVTSGQMLVHLTSNGEVNQSTTTVVMQSSATVFAIPVNGFNITASTTATSTSTPTPTATATDTTATPTASQPATQASLSAGAKAGAAIGAISGVALIAVAAFLLMRRRRQMKDPRVHEMPSTAAYPRPDEWRPYPGQPYSAAKEPARASSVKHELDTPVYELSGR